MVDESPRLELAERWFPTRVSAERSFSMFIEFNANARPGPDALSFVEIAWIQGVDRARSALPSYLPRKTVREMCRLFQPWPDGRYVDAHQRTGGILNLFTPPWGEKEDDVWAGLLVGWEAASFPDEDARQEALRDLENCWNHAPHPFFAGLTPAQVMVGGGPRECELADEFLDLLAQLLDGRSFESEGDVLIKTLLLLRVWSCQPDEDGRTPVEVIVAERNDLLARRERVLEIPSDHP